VNSFPESKIKCGDLVRRRSDPVHTGRVVRIELSKKLVEVRWLKLDCLECLISLRELEPAENWK
jgi:hypothetical protein